MAERATARERSTRTRTAGETSPGEPKDKRSKAPNDGAEDKGEQSHVCPVAFCPIGMALSSVQQVRPDVLEHLLSAAREFLLAARAIVDARASDFETKRDGGLKRIEIG